jgi:adenylate cyclase class 2
MPFNLEMKYKVDSHNEYRRVLKNAGAEYKELINQKDIYFKNKKALFKLRIQKNNNELIKYNRDESGKKRWSDYEILNITGKNPENYFTKLFDVTAVVEKKRELWIYNNTRIHLDKVKNLGYFLELETLVINGKIDAEKRFNKIVTLLKISIKDQILASYRDLILRKHDFYKRKY